MQQCRLSVCALSSMCHGWCMDGQFVAVWVCRLLCMYVLVRILFFVCLYRFVDQIHSNDFHSVQRHWQFKLHAACVLAMYFYSYQAVLKFSFLWRSDKQSLYFCMPDQTCLRHTLFTRYIRKTHKIPNIECQFRSIRSCVEFSTLLLFTQIDTKTCFDLVNNSSTQQNLIASDQNDEIISGLLLFSFWVVTFFFVDFIVFVVIYSECINRNFGQANAFLMVILVIFGKFYVWKQNWS